MCEGTPRGLGRVIPGHGRAGWAGPAYGLFGLGLSLYFSSLGAGKVIGPVLAGTLRLLLVALGGWVHNRALLIVPETQLAKGRAGS